MGKIKVVEIHHFEIELRDVGYDHSRAYCWEPGARIAVPKQAVVIETVDGIRGEYVPLWSMPGMAMGQTVALAPSLVGRDSTKREFFFDQAKRRHRKSDHIGYGVLDICLWDLLGKELGTSIQSLLGGYREELVTYASTLHGDREPGGLSSPERYADFAEQCASMGYRAFKMHPHSHDAKEEAATVRALADRVGDDMTLMCDLSSELRTFADAVTVGKACDEADFAWLEDPMSDTGVSQFAHRKLRSLIGTPLLITEHVRGIEPKADFLINDGTDIVRADPEIDMGITGVMKIAHMAEALGVDVELHGAGPAHRQCMAAIRNTNFYELTMVHPELGNPLIPPVYACDYTDAFEAISPAGTFPVPDGPGLGVTYDWDFIVDRTTAVQRFDEEVR